MPKFDLGERTKNECLILKKDSKRPKNAHIKSTKFYKLTKCFFDFESKSNIEKREICLVRENSALYDHSSSAFCSLLKMLPKEQRFRRFSLLACKSLSQTLGN